MQPLNNKSIKIPPGSPVVIFDGPNSTPPPPYEEELPRRANFLYFLFMILILILFAQSTTHRYYYTIEKINAGGLDGIDYDYVAYMPEQLHISLGSNSKEMYITWSTMELVNDSIVIYATKEHISPYAPYHYGRQRISMKQMVVKGSSSTFESTETLTTANNTSKVTKRKLYSYRAALANLIPNKVYWYRVESKVFKNGSKRSIASKTFTFKALTDEWPNDRVLRMAIYGDLGLVNGQSVPRLIKDVDKSSYDAIFHNGDFAYDLNTNNGAYGDEFMRKIEPISARVPYQTSVGNHEIAQNFSHYNHRFTMVNSGGFENGSKNNFYYSFNLGPVHFVVFSTEFYYFLEQTGMVPLHNQYYWIEEDLRRASTPDQRAKRPWIIVLGHRPMYCSSNDGDDCTKNSNILRKGLPVLNAYGLEKMFYNYGVDVLIWSHQHSYERFLPIYDSKVYNGTIDTSNPYHNARSPVHIVTGSAGCDENIDKFSSDPKTGSVARIADYGYTRMNATMNKLIFQQISDDKDGTVQDEFVIIKDKQNFPLPDKELN